jgi:hypothetical protein
MENESIGLNDPMFLTEATTNDKVEVLTAENRTLGGTTVQPEQVAWVKSKEEGNVIVIVPEGEEFGRLKAILVEIDSLFI